MCSFAKNQHVTFLSMPIKTIITKELFCQREAKRNHNEDHAHVKSTRAATAAQCTAAFAHSMIAYCTPLQYPINVPRFARTPFQSFASHRHPLFELY